MSREVLEEELRYFNERRQELLKTNKGQYALVKGREFAGAFTTFEEAYSAGLTKYGNVPFLIKQVLEEDPVHHIPALTCGLLR